MTARRRGTLVASVAIASAIALAATGCSSGPASDASGKITLTVATFGDFGYTKQLLAEYTKAHPNVTVVQRKAASSDDARTNLFTKLAAGSGLADIEAVDGESFIEAKQYSNKFTDLTDPSVKNRWVEWTYKDGLDAKGKLIGYRTDIGPQAVCYRKDLFAAAGLPTDRDAVAKLLTGSWDHYFDIGAQYKAKTGKDWYDSPTSILEGEIYQMRYSYENKSGKIIADTNPAVEKAFRQSAEEGVALSAGLGSFTDDWYAGLKNGTFATLLCPSWMLGIVSGNAPDLTDWDIADVYPGGGGNWGGSYLTVPAQGKHTAEAKKLANWLTAPAQQVKAFVNAGPFPSQVAAYKSSTLLDFAPKYYNGAPAGKIFSERAKAIDVVPFKSVHFQKINSIVQDGITRVAADKTQSVDASWKQVQSEIAALN